MQVIQAEAMGFCFGVRDALRATGHIRQPELVTIRGELVHNRDVMRGLSERGFRQQLEGETAELPDTPQVLITAHGVSDTELTRLTLAGKQIIDTTCPLVRRAHQAARELAAEGRHVVVIGRAGHVEVRGLTGDLASYSIVEQEADVLAWPHRRLGIVCQTTTPPDVADRMRRRIQERNPQAEIRFVNTVCQPTVDRLQAVEALLPRVDAVVVVGGRNSNNTTRLVELCRQRGTAAHHVENAAELRPEWFAGCKVVGLTAGTSTPDATIEAVARTLRDLSPLPAPARSAWSSESWCAYFRRNRDDLPAVPWETVVRLTAAERRAVAKSIAVFQLGESGEGRHVLRCAEQHGRERNDPNYLPAMRLFIQEEQRHAALLGRFLDEAGLSRLPREWTDGVFRWLRHQAGLELTITTLVTAEMLAKVYYAALRDATECAALRAICRRILRDETAHVQFQCQRVVLLQEQNPRWLRRIKRGLHALLFVGTALVLWLAHRSVFRAAGMNWSSYWRRAWRTFRHG